MAVDSVTGTQAAAQQGGSAAIGSAAATEDRFLKLLVAQMKNQDPLNPLDNAQVTSQMAQLSTVSGLDKINTTLTSMISSLAAQQGVAAAGLVGTEVAVAGDRIAVEDGKARGGFSLPANAEKVTVNIKDASGAVVRTMEMGAQKAGIQTFNWDGKDANGKAVANGSYTFSVEAIQSGKAVAATTLTVGTVRGVIPASDGFALDLGASGMTSFASVAQILSKPSTDSKTTEVKS